MWGDYAKTPTSAPVASSWNCEHCTFENSADKDACDMCCKTSPSRQSSPVRPVEQKVNLPSSPNLRAKVAKADRPGEKLAPSPTAASSIFAGGAFASGSDSAFGFATASSPGGGSARSASPSPQHPLVRSAFADHRSAFRVLNERRKALEEIGNVWKQGDIIGALKTVQLCPIDVQVDFLTFSSFQFCSNSKRNELLSLSAAAVVAPLCADILASDAGKEGIANLCVRYCHAILHAFDQRLATAVKNEIAQIGASSNPGAFVAQPMAMRDAECAKILNAFQRIAILLETVGSWCGGGSQPGGGGGGKGARAQLASIADSGAGSGNSGGQVAEVLARMQGLFRVAST